MSFALTEAEGGRDLARAAELTRDPLLRRLFLRHASDEQEHAALFNARGRELLAEIGGDERAAFQFAWLAPGERGFDDLRVDEQSDAALLAFLHLSEKAAAGRFALYRDVLADRSTADVFATVLRDEEFHMTYTRTQLARVDAREGRTLWRARAGRLWKAYLRLAVALAGLIGGLLLLVQYFVVIPLFALLAKRSARREKEGWSAPMERTRERALRSQY